MNKEDFDKMAFLTGSDVDENMICIDWKYENFSLDEDTMKWLIKNKISIDLQLPKDETPYLNLMLDSEEES